MVKGGENMINVSVNEAVPSPKVNNLSRSNAGNENGAYSSDFMSSLLQSAEELANGEMPVAADIMNTESDDKPETDILEMCMQMNSMFVPDMTVQMPQNEEDTELLIDSVVPMENSDVTMLYTENPVINPVANPIISNDEAVQAVQNENITVTDEDTALIQNPVQENEEISEIPEELQGSAEDTEIVIPEREDNEISDNTVKMENKDTEISDKPVSMEKKDTEISDEPVNMEKKDTEISDKSVTTEKKDVKISDETIITEKKDIIISDDTVKTEKTVEKIQTDNDNQQETEKQNVNNISQTESAAYVQAEFTAESSMTAENIADDVTDSKLSPVVRENAVQSDNLQTAEEDIPQIKMTVTHENAGHQKNGENSDAENNGEKQSFSNLLMQEHKLQSDFRNNINAVKNMLKNNTVNTAEEKNDSASIELSAKNLDIAGLQTMFVPDDKINEIINIAERSEIPETVSVIEQTADGIISHLSNGDEKFTIKLNPEGLGEITVTILKNDESSILTLSATDSKTAEILSGNIKALQENLKYLNIEISDVSTAAPEEAQNYNGYNRNDEYESNDSRFRKRDERRHGRDENDDDDNDETDYSVEDIVSF